MHIPYKWFLNLSLKFVSFYSPTHKNYMCFHYRAIRLISVSSKVELHLFVSTIRPNFNLKNKTYRSTLYLNIRNTKYEKEFTQYHYVESKCTNKIVFVLWKFESQCFLIDYPFSCLFVFSHASLDIFKLTKNHLTKLINSAIYLLMGTFYSFTV